MLRCQGQGCQGKQHRVDISSKPEYMPSDRSPSGTAQDRCGSAGLRSLKSSHMMPVEIISVACDFNGVLCTLMAGDWLLQLHFCNVPHSRLPVIDGITLQVLLTLLLGQGIMHSLLKKWL